MGLKKAVLSDGLSTGFGSEDLGPNISSPAY